MTIDKDRMGTQSGRGPERHRRVHSELTRCIRRCTHDSAFGCLASDDNRLPFKFRLEQFLDRDEEGVHIDVKYRTNVDPVAHGSIVDGWRGLSGYRRDPG